MRGGLSKIRNRERGTGGDRRCCGLLGGRVWSCQRERGVLKLASVG